MKNYPTQTPSKKQSISNLLDNETPFHSNIYQSNGISVELSSFENGSLIIIHVKNTKEVQKYDIAEHVTTNRAITAKQILVINGEMTLDIDKKLNTVVKHQLLDIPPFSTVSTCTFSSDFEGFIMVINPQLVMDSLSDKNIISVSNFSTSYKGPIYVMSDKEFDNIYIQMQLINHHINNTSNKYVKELVKTSLLMYVYELLNLISSNKHNTTKGPNNKSDKLTNDFFTLLMIHHLQEREVSFYANKLCVTPQYLSSILKKRTGKSIHKWIATVVMYEATFFLNSQTKTIQQISDILGFADQSSFGKFFKKHSGLSPLNYRRKNEDSN